MVTWVDPTELLDVISVIPSIRVKLFSSGVATEAAITSGLAPGRLAWTLMVGKSTSGNAEMGSIVYEIAPANVRAASNRVVATGLLMNGVEMFIEVVL